MKQIFLIAIVTLLSACATLSPENPMAETVDTKNANYGPYPSNYEALIKAWGEENLKDPESARYGKISKPRKEFMFKESKPFFGYSICAGINAKNSYGGYTGSQPHWFLIRDGKIARSQNTEIPIAGIIPGNTISRGHFVNCSDGDSEGN